MRLLSLLISAAFFVSGTACLNAGNADAKAIAAKAGELAADASSTSDQIVVLHRFVRDEILQVATQFG